MISNSNFELLSVEILSLPPLKKNSILSLVDLSYKKLYSIVIIICILSIKTLHSFVSFLLYKYLHNSLFLCLDAQRLNSLLSGFFQKRSADPCCR